MQKFGVFINPGYQQKKIAYDLIDRYLMDEGICLYCNQKQKEFMPSQIRVHEKGLRLDAIIVFGGDGTILSALDFALSASSPVWGINLGKLGFLSDLSMTEFGRYLPKLLQKNYEIKHRFLLNVYVKRKNQPLHQGYALNDAVIYKGLVSRLIELRFYCNKSFVLKTRCDGMIAATPTGSTAYSLAAGGPILSPEMSAMVVSPLNPHVLSVRPLVFPGGDELKFQLTNVYNETMLQLDGRNVIALIDGDTVSVRISDQKVQFVSVTGKSFYQTLRKKLHMGKI